MAVCEQTLTTRTEDGPTECQFYDYEHELDPVANLHQYMNDTCKYYTDAEFKNNIKMNGTFSLIHFNCRSLYSNFGNILDYLKSFENRFTVIALSETWLTEDKGAEFHFGGYELYYVNRNNRKGGGVALYICSDLKCKIIERMTTVVEDLMECLTVEIEMEKQRNIVITCVYRTPGSSVKTFIENLEQLLVGMNANKMSIFCGDFNLLNVSSHMSSSNFLDVMYSRGFHPVITRPSRITSNCATLIDNIFINVVNTFKRSFDK